jgi:hypothetical protein
MSVEWKPARYNDGWWAELPGGRSAWIYRPCQGRQLRPVNYLLVSVHFPEAPLRTSCARLTGNDPKDFLPEATRFLQSKNLVPSDALTTFPEAVALIQRSLF